MLIAGEAGLGKSQIGIAMAAAVTTEGLGLAARGMRHLGTLSFCQRRTTQPIPSSRAFWPPAPI